MDKNNLKLFDDIEHVYLGPSKYSEPYWEFLNRTARSDFQYVRELLQSWFDGYVASPEKRRHLWIEFRSSENSKHLSAFFELYLYQLFKEQGFEVEVEPDWEQGRPDFALTSPKGEKILLEATAIYPERWFGWAKKLEEVVIDHLNEHLSSPDFFLHINITKAPNDTPPYAQIRRYLEKQLARLDYDQVVQDALGREGMGLDRFPATIFSHDAWTIGFVFIPKVGEARDELDMRPVGSMFYGVEAVDTSSNIKSSIESKYGHYGELRIPYILAINIVDAYFHHESVMDALFGQEVLNLDLKTNETFRSRKRNGAWFGPDGYQKKRMSGICVFKRLRPETMHLVDAILWHHPYANNPLEPKQFYLSQKVFNPASRLYEVSNGKSPVELLKLDEAKMPR